MLIRERRHPSQSHFNPRVSLVGCFGFNGPLETVFESISGRLPERGSMNREITDVRKNV